MRILCLVGYLGLCQNGNPYVKLMLNISWVSATFKFEDYGEIFKKKDQFKVIQERTHGSMREFSFGAFAFPGKGDYVSLDMCV